MRAASYTPPQAPPSLQSSGPALAAARPASGRPLCMQCHLLARCCLLQPHHAGSWVQAGASRLRVPPGHFPATHPTADSSQARCSRLRWGGTCGTPAALLWASSCVRLCRCAAVAMVRVRLCDMLCACIGHAPAVHAAAGRECSPAALRRAEPAPVDATTLMFCNNELRPRHKVRHSQQEPLQATRGRPQDLQPHKPVLQATHGTHHACTCASCVCRPVRPPAAPSGLIQALAGAAATPATGQAHTAPHQPGAATRPVSAPGAAWASGGDPSP